MRWEPFALLSCLGCTPTAAPPEPQPATPPAPSLRPASTPPKVLSIVGNNDLHGHIERLPVLAGYVERLRELRSRDGGVLLLDAGDMFQGTLESNLNEGESVIAAYNAMGVTAAALGNHDFDYGPAGDREPGPGIDPQGAIELRLAQATFPVLSSNLRLIGDGPPIWKNLVSDALVVEVAGVSVGIVGGLTEETPSIVMPAFFRGLEVTPLAQAIERGAERARAKGARVVIALVHAGADCTRFDDPHDTSSCDDGEVVRLARALPTGAVDAIIAGHSHKGVAHFFAGIPVAEAYCYGCAFSRIDVGVPADDKAPLELHVFPPQPLCPATSSSEPCIPGSYEGKPVRVDAAISQLIGPYLARAKTRREESLGVHVAADIRGAMKTESPLGNLLADELRASVTGADVAIVNGGSLRAPLETGELTYGALYEAQPFDNHVAVLKLTGHELRTVLATHLKSDRHGIVSLGGMTIVASCKGPELDLAIRRANGKPLRDDETVTLVTSDYLATGGDDLFVPLKLAPDRIEIRPETVRDAIAARLRQEKGTLSPSDPRLFDPKHPRLSLSGARPLRCGQ